MYKTFAYNFIKISCFIGFGLSLSTCGDTNSLSKAVKFAIVPDDPIVIRSTFTQNPGEDNELEITGPWFEFGYYFYNGNSNEAVAGRNTLTVATIRFEINGFKNGAIVEKEYAMDPSAACEEAATGEDGRPYVGIVAAKTAFSAAEPCDSKVIYNSGYETWYVDSLPKSDNDYYNAKVTTEGWFENEGGEPIERFEKFTYISTR